MNESGKPSTARSPEECQAVRQLLALRPHDRSSAEERQLQEHLVTCSTCAASATEHEVEDRFLSATPSIVLSLPQRRTLFARLQAERKRFAVRSKVATALGAAAACAAVAAFILVAGLALRYTGGPASGLSGTSTALLTGSLPTSSPAVVSPSPSTNSMPAARAALAQYEPPSDPSAVVEALVEGIAQIAFPPGTVDVPLDGTGYQSTTASIVEGELRTLPRLEGAEVSWVALENAAHGYLVVQPHLMGVPTLLCFDREETALSFSCRPAPGTFGEPMPTMESGFLSQDLSGDSYPEAIITYTVQGGSGWTELLYIYRWDEAYSLTLAFHATLVNWAGPSHWALEPDPGSPAKMQIVLSYPYLWGDGYDHKLLNHPQARQVWRLPDGAARYQLAEQTVDLETSGSGPGTAVSVDDAMRWATNQGEAAFAGGNYEGALERYQAVLALATGASSRGTDQPDWAGYARFRAGECLALLGRSGEAAAALRTLAEEYSQDALGNLAQAFLAGYGDGSAADAAARGIAAMQSVDLYTHLYEERGGALRFPMDAARILYPGAGLGAYLDAHPELTGDAGALLAGLQGAGFAAEGVQRNDGRIYWIDVFLRLPQAPGAGGVLARWRLNPPSGLWLVMPSDGGDLPAALAPWPSVGGMPAPRFAPEVVESVPEVTPPPAGNSAQFLEAVPGLANSIPMTICQSSAIWTRPSEAEQAAQVWSSARYEGVPLERLWWTLQQPFYSYGGGSSELYDAWPLSGLWTAAGDSYQCDPEGRIRALVTGQEIELWLLLHQVVAAQEKDGVYTITVRPAETGYQLIRLPGPGGPPASIHFVDETGQELDRLPKDPPWTEPGVDPASPAVTVVGQVVDNAASARVVTLRDAAGAEWSLPWLDSTVVRRSDGTPAYFRDLQAGVTVEVVGMRKNAATPNTLVAIRVTMR